MTTTGSPSTQETPTTSRPPSRSVPTERARRGRQDRTDHATTATVTTPAPVVGSPVQTSDTATLSGATGPLVGATVSFWLVGPVPPGSPACARRSSSLVAPIIVPLDPVTATATTGLVTFTPTLAGDYYWIAQFAGDSGKRRGDDRVPRPGRAGSRRQGDASRVPPAATVATSDPVVNQPVTTSDTATLTGAVNPDGTGTVTFWLVGRPRGPLPRARPPPRPSSGRSPRRPCRTAPRQRAT